MKEVNRYYEGFNDTNNRMDYLKYGLLNEFGHNLGLKAKDCYNEDKIIKTSCNHRES